MDVFWSHLWEGVSILFIFWLIGDIYSKPTWKWKPTLWVVHAASSKCCRRDFGRSIDHWDHFCPVQNEPYWTVSESRWGGGKRMVVCFWSRQCVSSWSKEDDWGNVIMTSILRRMRTAAGVAEKNTNFAQETEEGLQASAVKVEFYPGRFRRMNLGH